MTEPLSTKERIIEKASDIFGHEGFKAATIRKIAAAADVNIAAINYHFRDKEGLYREVLNDIFLKGFEKYPSVPGPDESQDPVYRLKVFIRSLFYRFLSEDGWQGPAGKGRLIAKEFLDPTPAFEDIVETYIKPHKEILVSIVSDVSGGRIDARQLVPCALSIIGQCIYYAFASPVISKIAHDLNPTREKLDFLSDHVLQFSLGGILLFAGQTQDNNKDSQ